MIGPDIDCPECVIGSVCETARRLGAERDALRARVAELEASDEHWRKMIQSYADHIESQREDIDSLNGIVERLSAPPVVPEGWEVRQLKEWYLRCSTFAPLAGRAAAYRALAWAIEHDQRPPHTGDGETP